MAFTNVNWPNRDDKDVSTADSGASDGGDGVQDVWTQDRTTQLQRLAGGSFTNLSSFDLPKGVTVGRWSTAQSDAEKRQGVYVEGTFTDVDSTPLSGTAEIDEGGEVLGSVSGSGSIIASSPPPSGVTSGTTEQAQSINFTFTPTKSGIDFVDENISTVTSLGVIQYGSLEGAITDVDGNPVKGIGVSGSGASATSDGNGEYSLLGPDSINVNISVIGTTTAVNFVGGSVVTEDFQLSRLNVTVVAPDGTPVPGAPVTIQGKSFKTDEDGVVTLDRAFLRQYDISVGSAVNDSITISSQGSVIDRSYGNAFSALRISASSEEENSPILSTSVSFDTDTQGSVPSETNSNGEATALLDSGGVAKALVSDGDKRFINEEVNVTLTLGKVVEENVTLEKKDNISTF